MVKAVRGANSVAKNDVESMEKAVLELVTLITEKNNIEEDNIISIIFSQTKDLNVANPAAALRTSGEYFSAPLFCTQEPEYQNSIASILRVMITFETEENQKVIPVYLNGAIKLRRDLSIDG